jgi:hypothetical protein
VLCGGILAAEYGVCPRNRLEFCAAKLQAQKPPVRLGLTAQTYAIRFANCAGPLPIAAYDAVSNSRVR